VVEVEDAPRVRLRLKRLLHREQTDMAFIVFEGLDGAGKSTLIKGLEATLSAQRINFVTTREPGGTRLGDDLRQILLKTQGEIPSPKTELLLYEAGRAQHVDFVIRPALEKKSWVLCDRFTASSIAFQSGGRNLVQKDVEWLNNFATEKLCPDLTVLLDLTVEESQKRREKREIETNSHADRFEKEAADFHERVRKSYLALAKAEPAKWLVLDASAPRDVALQKMLDELRKKKWLAG
jgi:dTMP kinase